MILIRHGDPINGATSYEIRGFRSLVDFSVTLLPGINVLVGPNGAGKTNFIEFLDFIDRLITSGAASAIASAGGVARVFSQEAQTNQAFTMKTLIGGCAQLTDSDASTGPSAVFRFEYQLTLRFSKAASALYIASERITFYQLSPSLLEPASRVKVGSISVTRNSRADDLQASIKVGPRLKEDQDANPLRMRPQYQKKYPIDQLVLSPAMQSLAPDESMLRHGWPLPALDAVKSALTRGRVFNVIPDRVREAEDLTRPPGIARDGSGLTPTLYYLQQYSLGRVKRRVSMRRANRDSFSSIVTWTRLVFRELQSLTVGQDYHSGKYSAVVNVSQSGLSLPLQSVSDGTLKWLSLVTMIMTTGGIFSIEEPENFLHPKMQRFLIDLIRESIPSKPLASHCIVSTHSETAISECNPNELLLFRFEEGQTRCGRIKNPERVLEEVNKSGFGLGHFYAANALS